MSQQAQLIHDAINHKNGKVPHAIYMTGDTERLYGEKIFEDFPNKQAQEDYKNGLINYGQAISIAIGNSLVHVGLPWWKWHITDSELWSAEDNPGVMPDVIGTGSYEKFFEQIEHIRANYDVYILATIYGSHWEKAYFSRGIENFLADMAGDPDWAQQLLDTIIRKNLVMMENFLVRPEIDGVLLGSDWGTQRDLIMSPESWRKMIKPGEEAEYKLVKKYGKHVFIHSCGCITGIMKDIVELGVDVLNPVQPECMDLKQLKSDYGSKLTYYGGISTQKTLPYGTPAEVAAETARTIELMAKDGGYITASSQELQSDVPYENVKALIETAKRYCD